ncbi:MAG: hypothetical protein MI919_16860, partial [Holophagales bacterium]|nr:hypothetical protein [Holophagales bacterium]
MYCPQCGGEFEAGTYECNDCRVALVARAPAEPEAAASVAGRLGWTVALLAVYLAMGHVPLPLLDLDALRELGEIPRGSILVLGITPFIAGFLLVELFSLLTPWGRRAREGGSGGRRKLTRWAVGCSIVVAMVQALGMTLGFERLTTLSGMPLIADPGIASRVLCIVTLVAGSAMAFFLCHGITARGIGNGFCLVYVLETVGVGVSNLRFSGDG